MGDLKPLGSEKLTGQDKLKRIMEIARFNEVIPSKVNETAKSEYSIPLADGNKYEIVKERQGYIIKKTISESETEYIEPMKNRKYYSSYSQAFKRLNLVAGELNRINENEEGVSLYGEQKKFVLKTPKPKEEPAPIAEVPAAPPAVPAPALPPSPNAEMPMGDDSMDLEMGAEEMGPEGDVEVDAEMDVDMETPEMSGEETVTFRTIQKLTGKLTQKIRTLDNQEGMTSEDVKYVINMVLSSLDLKSLSEEDKEDILAKFEEDSEDLGGDDMGGEDLTDDSEVEDIQSDMDVAVEGEMEEEGYGNGAIIDSIFSESPVDKVISKYFEVSKKEILENKEKKAKKKLQIVSEVRKQMKSIIKLTESVEQELAAQKFLEENISAKIIGKTNKKNLVFENKGKEVKISPEGLLV
jgi:ribosomal protein L35